MSLYGRLFALKEKALKAFQDTKRVINSWIRIDKNHEAKSITLAIGAILLTVSIPTLRCSAVS